MAVDRQILQERFQTLADAELLRLCRSAELTDDAQAIAVRELGARGLTLAQDSPAPAAADEIYLGDWVMVARYLSYTEVHLLQSCLEAAGIPALAADAHLLQTDALLGPAMRGASLKVPAACAAEARELVAAYQRGDFRLDESFDPGGR
ncbi:MAG: hypothetical protein OEW21_08715 [Betaproteobacteria bacterium]|nr:hypothetical protein [Betaproteobacteria bacterium]